jgi:hypothetical protein
MKKIFRYAVIAAALVICLGTGGAWAKDAIVTSVTNNDGAAVISNGSFTSLGTYSIGTIQLWKEIIATEFPSTVGPFRLCFVAQQKKDKPATKYAVTASLRQTGSANVEIDPDIPSYELQNAGDGWCTDVYIHIPPEVIANPNFQLDGSQLVGILQIVAPTQSFLDTVTSILFKLILKTPVDSTCLYLTNFIAENGLSMNYSDLGIDVSVNRFGVVSTAPPNYQNVVLVANICGESKTFDLDITKSADFNFNGAQAVKVSSDDIVLLDDTAFFTNYDPPNNFSPDVPHGVNLCVANFTLPANSTLLTRVALTINDATTNYPDSNSDFPFAYDTFTATVKVPNATCGAGAALPDPAEATPNPATTELPVNENCITVGSPPSTTTTCYPTAP